jgi:hypothetical protein
MKGEGSGFPIGPEFGRITKKSILPQSATKYKVGAGDGGENELQ